MFCPKCGNSLPDDAAFCGGCGNKIEANQENPIAGSQNATTRTSKITDFAPSVSSNAFPPIVIAAVAVAAIALLFAFLPWYESSRYLLGLGNVGSTLGSWGSALSGQNYNVANFEESYSVFGFLSLASDLSSYSSYGLETLLIPAFILWLISVVLVVGGVLLMLFGRNRSKALLIAGLILLAITSFAWMGFYGKIVYGDYATGFPTNALVCGIACVIALVLTFVAKKSQA